MTGPGTADGDGSADGTESTHTGEGVDAATLLGDDREAFETALSDGSTGPIAVVGAPYAGRAVVLDDPDDSGLVTTRRYRIGWRDRSVSIPVPAPNLPAIAGLRDGDPDPRDVVFERLAAVSGGNPGVATAVWKSSRGAEVRPSDVAAPGRTSSSTARRRSASG